MNVSERIGSFIKKEFQVLLMGLLFLLYGFFIILNLSFKAIDGKRYFTIFDDFLITLRYSWNFAHGKGLVWNAGEHVEGITNLLWAVYASFLAFFSSKRMLPFLMQISAVILLILMCFVFSRLPQLYSKTKFKLEKVTGVFAFVIPFLYFPMFYWSVNGSEMALQSLLIVLAIYYLLLDIKQPKYFWVVLLALAYVTRPDTIVTAGILFAFHMLHIDWKNRTAIKRFLKHAGIFVGILLVVQLFRLAYYGSFVPNTYILRATGLSIIERISLNGIPYIASFVAEYKWLLALLVLSVVIKPTRYKLLLFAVIVFNFLYTIYIGGDPFSRWRFLVLYMPYVYFILLMDSIVLADYFLNIFNIKNKSEQFTKLLVIVFGVSISIVLIQGHVYIKEPKKDDVANINTAIYLNEILKKNASVGVFYAGAVPYYTDFYAIDFLGKSDRYIAQLPPDRSGAVSWYGLKSVPGHNKYDLEYSILNKKPTYIAGTKWGAQNITYEASEFYIKIPTRFKTETIDDKNTIILEKDSEKIKWELCPKPIAFEK
ncbi:hypothetical protein K8S19_13630 [bacterium]|nr:hypothetical protein [bacterium]